MSNNRDKGLEGNELIEKQINELRAEFTDENLARVLTTIRKRALENGQFVVPVDVSTGDNMTLKTAEFNGRKWFVAYTGFEEELKGDISVVSGFMADIGQIFELAMKSDEVEGVLLNPYGNLLTLDKQIIEVITGTE